MLWEVQLTCLVNFTRDKVKCMQPDCCLPCFSLKRLYKWNGRQQNVNIKARVYENPFYLYNIDS